MAIDLTGDTLIWDGVAWRIGAVVPGASALTYSVACPTANDCVLARSDGSVVTWRDGSWGQPVPVLGGTTLATADISCSAPSFCAVVTSSGAVATSRP